ncbi:phage antirepressor KilAC domain-containing protein [Rodentibacter haemolyticus]|uniref:Phage antirepressor KilAC domain-containing protein n=1 Tax=Rodentibacter haemolyticus TaxID=2778911 RepID=A0ABX6UVS6_9PAST|nr:phage antirepressor KilAC domain-containing protein [Rodentibacter haemolyticus]QPB42173.1 phage antirepressor KilAC domain-containing protein [Rodentibacter haemolyticus]
MDLQTSRWQKLDRYQDKLQSGLLEHKIHTATKDDGTEKICEQVLVTAKGLAKLSKMLESNLLN